MMRDWIFLLALLWIIGCAEPRQSPVEPSNEREPEWTQDTEISWMKGDRIFFRSRHTVRADNPRTECLGRAKENAKQYLSLRIATDIRNGIATAGLVPSKKFVAALEKLEAGVATTSPPLKQEDAHFGTYRIGAIERLDCHWLSFLTLKEWERYRRSVLGKMLRLDPQLEAAVRRKNVVF